MPTDRELLAGYLAKGDSSVFTALVDRYSRMVYVTCLRILGDEHSAQDAAQAAFFLLARNAKRLPRGTILSGWLYTTACNCARHLKRSQVRRRRHEAEASLMRAHDQPSPSWEKVKPELDAAMVALPARQCQAVVLRYLGGRSYLEAANEMGCAESTFKAHLSAGLDKLRARLAGSGAVLSAATFTGWLSAQAEVEVPAGLAASLQAVCLGSAVAPASALAIAEGTAKAILWSKLKLAALAIGAATAVGAAGTVAAVSVLAPAGRNYYVAPTGAPGNPGTLEAPFKDPLAAAAFLQPGDTLYFRRGAYKCRTDWLVGLAPARSGLPGRPISLRACPGEPVVVDCTGSDWGLTPNGRSHIVIDGFEIRNDTGYGVKIAASSEAPGKTGSHVTVRNCRVRDTNKEGIFAWETPQVRLENCLASGSRTSHGVSIQNGCRGAVVARVTSLGNALNGIKVHASEDVLVKGCLVQGNGRGLEIGGARNCTFRGNVLFGNAFRGPLDSSYYEILMEGAREGGLADPGCRGNLLEGNTVANPGGAQRRLRSLVQVGPGCTATTFRGNILYARGQPLMTFASDSLRGHVFAGNRLFSAGGAQASVPGDDAMSLSDLARRFGLEAAGNVVEDPLFVNAEAGDLHLKDGSPAKGCGAALPVGCSPAVSVGAEKP